MLLLLGKGASFAVACRELGLPVDALWHTLRSDADFDARVQQVYETLSHNVVSALYKAAIGGNVTAQRLWLQHRPADLWSLVSEEKAASHAHLSDQELVDSAREAIAALGAAVERFAVG